ncbi:HpcH/HpaI aldolase/citrate lyase family protein [Spirillospora sp. CA-128828]|uniref:HpcH/HpaI aldolase/citrate lyase family protein n=1 Tax=Spirillospora sp. CA-128828 TaxID=3240033 RepID=UPI003D8CA2FD
MTPLITRVRDARTLLFVPGDRPERFAKAHEAAPGLVVLDLEDAVPAAHKTDARAQVAEWLAAGHTCAVRINPPGTPWHDEDVRAIAGHGCAVVVPKAEDVAALRAIAARLAAPCCLIALIETARGVLGARHLASLPGVERLAFGSFDLAAQLGVSPDDRDALAASRGALVLASAAAGIAPPVDGVTGSVGDPDRVRDDVRYSRRLGLTGKLCVHPRQLPAADEALRPTGDELRWARSVTQAAAAGGVVVLAGQMVDRPVVERAQRILRTARSGEQS